MTATGTPQLTSKLWIVLIGSGRRSRWPSIDWFAKARSRSVLCRGRPRRARWVRRSWSLFSEVICRLKKICAYIVRSITREHVPFWPVCRVKLACAISRFASSRGSMAHRDTELMCVFIWPDFMAARWMSYLISFLLHQTQNFFPLPVHWAFVSSLKGQFNLHVFRDVAQALKLYTNAHSLPRVYWL